MNDAALRNSLKKLVNDVSWEKEILDYYSVDCSSYQIRPRAVVFPKNTKEIVSVICFAQKNNIPAIARGAGTGLVGSALGRGIILDLKRFNKINIAKDYVTVDAGVRKGDLDRQLAKVGKFFGPNPSVGPYCTIGGMVATNASGSRSLKYGSFIDNLLEVTMVTGNGQVIKLPSKNNLAKFVLKIAKKINKKSYPDVTKNSCGYRLDAVNDISDLQKVIAGSEGTLGIILSAKLRIAGIPKKRSLLILGYSSAKNAALDCKSFVKLKPSALEFVDNHTLKNFDAKFPAKTKCLLFLEFDSNVAESIQRLKKLPKLGRILHQFDKKDDMQRWWKFRDSALYYSIKNIMPDESMPHVIEDAAVPLEKLPNLFAIASKLKKTTKSKIIMYGHAGNGNIHIRLVSKNNNKKTIRNTASWFFSRIIEIGGTITGEHGDGLARSEFVRIQYGSKTYSEFVRLKKRFDPAGILNPDKIISKKSTITKNLVIGA